MSSCECFYFTEIYVCANVTSKTYDNNAVLKECRHVVAKYERTLAFWSVDPGVYEIKTTDLDVPLREETNV